MAGNGLKLRKETDYSFTNRESSQEPKLGKSYCRCDRVLIGDGETCSYCGYKKQTKRRKAGAR
jgi:hypothetical protein